MQIKDKIKSIKFLNKILSQVVFGFFCYEKDNIDFSRFPEIDQKEKSKFKMLKNKTRHLIMWVNNVTHLIINVGNFTKSYNLLCDEKSKELYIRLLVYKVLGHKHIKIDKKLDWHVERKFLDIANQFYNSESDVPLSNHSIFGKLNNYRNIPTDDGMIQLDCWAGGIVYPKIKKQYYFCRNNISVKPESGDIIIDGGGCFGDTSIFFAKSVGDAGKVYVFDPLTIHGAIIKKNILQNNLKDRVIYFPYAIGEISNDVSPERNLDYEINPGFTILNESSLPILSIDDFVKKNQIKKIDFIKMDIEGYELLALKGAAQTIKTHMPKLAISIYHKKEDFYAIPLWLNQLTDGYDFYIDHYTMHAEETVLYVAPRKRNES